MNRLKQMGAGKNGTQQANYVYTLGAAGNRLTVAELSGRTVNYGYDSLYRLTSEAITNDPNNHNNTTQYQYDNVGNRQQLIVNGTTANVYSYDADDRLGSDQYDANGNTTSSAGTASTYDFENHLISKGGVTVVYDGDGNRVSETVAGVTTQYLVDTQNPTGYAQVVDEIQNGSVVRRYSWGLELISKLETGNSKLNFYGFDGHGSVRFLTDSTGNVTDTYDYDAFGNLINQTGSTPNNYLFAGEQYDPALGLYYNRARYLKTTTGRFWSMDSYEGDPQSPGSLHKYVYVEDAPVSSKDPSGLQLEDFGIAAATEGVLTAISLQLVGAAAIAGTAFHYLPHDAFLKHPSGKIGGLQGSYPIGKLLAKYPANPFLVGLGIGFQFTAGVGGIEILEPEGSTQPWLYAVLGLSIGVSDGSQSLLSGGNSPFNLDGLSFSAAYFGEAYNVKNAEDYAGPFYCVSASRGLGQFPGLPVGPNVSVCSSAPKEDGTAGAYSWSISPLASKGFGVGTSVLNYTYLFQLP